MLQAQQGGIDGSLIELQQVFAHLLDPARNAVAVQRPHRFQRLQHHQIERALQDGGLVIAHRIPCR
jgi:hypothetical protein